MPETTSGARSSTMQLILVPSIITLAITVLRLVGELQHWPKLLFSPSAGGGGAIVGISWLPFIFGPYFAVKLIGSGEGPSSKGKVIGFAVLGFVLMVLGGILTAAPKLQFPGKTIVGLVIMAVAGLLPWSGWPALFKTLLAYAYAARIPVAIIMYFAISGTWGTHYDALPPNYNGPAELWPKYALIGLAPQLIVWPAFTTIVGSLFGGIAAAIVRRDKPTVQTAA
ncbi:MAG: hypothetical protein ABSB82_23410 [Terriglobia bacterium]